MTTKKDRSNMTIPARQVPAVERFEPQPAGRGDAGLWGPGKQGAQ